MMISLHAIALVGLFAPLLLGFGGAQAEGVKQVKPETRESLDPALAAELETIDRKLAQIRDLTTDFEERKFTSLLKKPLVSRGKMQVVGSGSRWDTITPQPTIMVLSAAGIRIYYPQRSTLEVYKLDEKLQWLAFSPLSKLADLVSRFTIERIPVVDLGSANSATTYLGLRLTPRDEAIGKYLHHIDIVLNTTTAYIVRVEMFDADGDRTVISYSNTRVNTGIEEKDIELIVPAGTQVVRPLAGLENEPPDAPP